MISMNNRFSDVLHQKADLINAYLDSKVSQKDNLQGIVYEAMRYSLLAGGKRIRPVLALAAGQVLGEQEACILPFACAIEMIHTYSLIHDDLPAMDDDDYRRGRYSCHKKFGEATAILAGDALLTMAFEIAAEGALALENPKRGLRADPPYRAQRRNGGHDRRTNRGIWTRKRVLFLKASCVISAKGKRERCFGLLFLRQPPSPAQKRRGLQRCCWNMRIRSALPSRSKTIFWTLKAISVFWEKRQAVMQKTERRLLSRFTEYSGAKRFWKILRTGRLPPATGLSACKRELRRRTRVPF